MPRKPANKVSKGRTPKPTANNIRNMNQDVTRNYDKKTLTAYDKLAQKLESKARNTKPVGPNARNAVASRGRMGGTGAAIAGAVLNAPAELKKLQALLRNPKGALSRASSDILSGKPYNPQTVPKASKPATSKPATPSVRKLGTAMSTKLGVALRPVGRAIDRAIGKKPKKKPK